MITNFVTSVDLHVHLFDPTWLVFFVTNPRTFLLFYWKTQIQPLLHGSTKESASLIGSHVHYSHFINTQNSGFKNLTVDLCIILKSLFSVNERLNMCYYVTLHTVESQLWVILKKSEQ